MPLFTRFFLLLSSIQQWGALWLPWLVAFSLSSLLNAAAYNGVSSILFSKGSTPWSGILWNILIQAAFMAACVVGLESLTACARASPDTEYLKRLAELYPKGYFVGKWCSVATKVFGTLLKGLGESEETLLPTTER